MKFKVHSPEHSEAIQKKLFELGYKWACSGKERYLGVNSNFLYTDTDAQITHGTDAEWFNNKSYYVETTLDDLYKAPKFSVVRLNGIHEAIIDKENKIVLVGCERFAFSRIEDLYKEMMK